MTDAEYQRWCAENLRKQQAKGANKRDRTTSLTELNPKRKSVFDRPNGHPYF